MHAPRFLFPFYSVYISSSLYGSTSIHLISLTESLWKHPYRHIQRCISYLSDSTFGKQTMKMLCSLLEPQLACFDTETVKCANLAYKFTLLSCTQRKVISGYKAYSHKEKKNPFCKSHSMLQEVLFRCLHQKTCSFSPQSSTVVSLKF